LKPVLVTDELAIEGAPRLDRVRELVMELARAPWFAACGEALTPAENDETALYLSGLDLPAQSIAGIADWRAAAATSQRADWSRAWWEAEDRAAKVLHGEAARAVGEATLLAALSRVTEAATGLHGLAALAAARADIADPALSRVAAGAAALACHHAGLARAAGAPETHALLAKYRLFAGGRWLLGVMGECCYVF
jgi:hypothetical protein